MNIILNNFPFLTFSALFYFSQPPYLSLALSPLPRLLLAISLWQANQCDQVNQCHSGSKACIRERWQYSHHGIMCFHACAATSQQVIADMRLCTTPLHPHPVFLASAQPVTMETVSSDICCLVSCSEAEFCFLSVFDRGKAHFIYFFAWHLCN